MTTNLHENNGKLICLISCSIKINITNYYFNVTVTSMHVKTNKH